MRYRDDPHARIVYNQDGSVSFFSSYDRHLVDALKADIPWKDRRWLPDEKCWRVDARHIDKLVELADLHLLVEAEVQGAPNKQRTGPQVTILELEYLGTAKERADGSVTAFGWVDGDWNVVIPLDVLKTWFNIAVHDVSAPVTLYGVLGVKSDIVGADLKRAYRRAAKQWHPDVNPEQGAKEQFIRIQEAYEILSDPLKRRRYDAGLAFERTLPKTSTPDNPLEQRGSWWYPPLRCGYITVEGTQALGRWTVDRIHDWQDIESGGKTMISYWPQGADHFRRKWV